MPSSLTEDRSSTLGSLPLPTSVGVRYGSGHGPRLSLAGPPTRGFSWQPGHHVTCASSAEARARSQRLVPRFSLEHRLPACDQPCPFGRLTLPTASPPCPHALSAGFSTCCPSPTLDCPSLGLGPDSPWDDCRCPGTLRLPVWRVLTAIDATHSGIRTSVRSTSAHALASPLLPNAPLPRWPPARSTIRSFGTTLQPRYILGAGALDQ